MSPFSAMQIHAFRPGKSNLMTGAKLLPKACYNQTVKGFTLAELLITLAIVSLIATFTIPKIITSQASSQKNATAKEVAGMISAAYQQLQQTNTVSSATNASDLTPYMNYVSVTTTGSVDLPPTQGAIWSCSSLQPCLILHNGGKLLSQNNPFGSTTQGARLLFLFDPDTVWYSSGAPDDSSRSVQFLLYYNGKISSRASISPGNDPSWFNWFQ